MTVFISKIDSLVKSFKLMEFQSEFQYSYEEVGISPQEHDILLFYYTAPTDEIRLECEVVNYDNKKLSMRKLVEVASGLSYNKLPETVRTKIDDNACMSFQLNDDESNAILKDLSRAIVINMSPEVSGNNRKDDYKEGKCLQIIYYGAPGTGKSFGLKDEIGTTDKTKEGPIREDNNIRITFHPDTDYASFVGCYKPMQQEGHEENIVYEYQQEAFIDSYLEAWKSYLSDKAENFYLVIEEINRGNCAQIFGDMFQLLDRDEKGYSSYKVSTDRDLQRYLEKELKNEAFKNMPSDLKQGKWMQLPPNFCILATMNTSDQSLFPMDSAFKRRWEWRYVPIRTKDIRNIRIDIGGIEYSWADFVIQINDYIQKKTGSTAKQIGPWFAKADKKVNENDEKPTVISYENFRSKVLFFLFNDALRDYDDFGQMFEKEGEKREYPFLFENLFDDKVEDDGISNVEHFLGELKVAKYTDNAENQQEDNDDDGSNNDGVE